MTECRGAFADVNGYVEDCAFNAAHEFALCIWHALIVQTAHHAIGLTLSGFGMLPFIISLEIVSWEIMKCSVWCVLQR